MDGLPGVASELSEFREKVSTSSRKKRLGVVEADSPTFGLSLNVLSNNGSFLAMLRKNASVPSTQECRIGDRMLSTTASI